MARWYDMRDRCMECGRFVQAQAPGVSWAVRWHYCMDGSPELDDPIYRCSPCTDTHGVPWTNCAPGYNGSGRNPVSPPEPTPPLMRRAKG